MTTLFHLLLQNTTQVLAVISTLFGIAATIFSLSSFFRQNREKEREQAYNIAAWWVRVDKKLH